MENPHPTLADVAREAGVSPSTASIAFSGTGPVAQTTRQKVLAAAERLHYAGPDPRARSLRRGRSGIVGVVVEDRVRSAFSDPIMVAMLDGLAEELGTIDAGMLVLTDRGRSGVGIDEAPMDAVALIGCSPRLVESMGALRRRGIPIVAIEGVPADGVVTISLDNRAASRALAEHLRDLGHDRVAVVALPIDVAHERGPLTPEREAASNADTALARLAGVRDVYPGCSGLVAADSSAAEGALAASELLDAGGADARPTAIIAQSDLMAAGVIRAAEERGIRVPEELSVVGFDGVRVEGLWPYELTTMVQPAVDKGRAAGRAICAMLAGGAGEAVAFTSVFRRGNTTAPKLTAQA